MRFGHFIPIEEHMSQHFLYDSIESTLSSFRVKMDNRLQNSQVMQQYRIDLFKQLLPLSTDIAHPGKGKTWQRWQILAHIAGIDLTVAKWFESHLDSLSIIDEVTAGTSIPLSIHSDQWWAIWAADGGTQPLKRHEEYLAGTKLWCSAASLVDYGLLTYRDDQQRSCLAIVDMRAARTAQQASISDTDWQAIGMSATQTETLQLDQVACTAIGQPNDYLDRAGFWHGAAGVAACWLGAALAMAKFLFESQYSKPNAYKAAALGEVLTTLEVTRHYGKELAYCIDRDPTQSHVYQVRLFRAQVERCVEIVLKHVGTALGAAPFCQSAHYAQLAADLPVFIRQSHGAFDLQHIAELSYQSLPSWHL